MPEQYNAKGFDFPYILGLLVQECNRKTGSEYIEAVTHLYDNIIGGYDADGSFELEMEAIIKKNDEEIEKLLRGTRIWSAMTTEAKAANGAKAAKLYKHEYDKARLLFRHCLKRVEDLMPEKSIVGEIEDETENDLEE